MTSKQRKTAGVILFCMALPFIVLGAIAGIVSLGFRAGYEGMKEFDRLLG